MSDKPTVFEAWNSVMKAVQSIGKDSVNREQGFKFRGIDTVVDKVGPVLREHGVIVVPSVLEHEPERYLSKKGANMLGETVKVSYTVYGPAGDFFTGSTYGAASDAGDKAMPKAESVALRVFLLEALMIPTGDPDPDAESHERAARDPVEDDFIAARNELAAKAAELGFTREGMEDRCIDAVGQPVTAEKIRDFIKTLPAAAVS